MAFNDRARSKKDMYEDMILRLSEFSMQAARAHIQSPYLQIPENTPKFPADFIRPAYKWLLTVWNNEWAEVLAIWSKLPCECWEYFESIGKINTREYKILRQALWKLRKRIISNNRPDLFKKGPVNEQERTLKDKKARK